MTLIKELTQAQQARLIELREHALRCGRSTEPLDRDAASDTLCALHQAAGLPCREVRFFPSPKVMCEHHLDLQESRGLRPDDDPYLRVLHHYKFLDPLFALSHVSYAVWLHVKEQLDEVLSQRLFAWLDLQLGQHLRQTLFSGPRASYYRTRLNGPWGCHLWVESQYWAELGLPVQACRRQRWALWLKQLESTHKWLTPLPDLVLASERPCLLRLDSRGALHSESGPALEYADGFALYAWHGTVVEERLIADPASITVAEIENAWAHPPRARVLIERFGIERYMQEGGSRVVDEIHGHPTLTDLVRARLLLKERLGEPEPLVYLQATAAQPDGSLTQYMERISPHAYGGDAGRCCYAALASLVQHPQAPGRLKFERWQDSLLTEDWGQTQTGNGAA